MKTKSNQTFDASLFPANHDNFLSYPTAPYSPFSVPYDYASITHYGRKAMSINGQDTIVPNQVGAIIGEAKALSELDIKKINNMYCNGALGMMIRSVYDGSVSGYNKNWMKLTSHLLTF